MNRPALAVAAAVSAVLLSATGCSSSQSGGSSNPDNQATQPPLPTGDSEGGATPAPAAS
ncbi:MAG: hypothetical protein M3P93_01700 [Actinomycetota bacterium]|jgi:hypothetical protein|nr:hypothetical protein [Actinomycetota bacterium]